MLVCFVLLLFFLGVDNFTDIKSLEKTEDLLAGFYEGKIDIQKIAASY